MSLLMTVYLGVHTEISDCDVMMLSFNCVDGSVRLVDGLIEQEGRVEVCVNGVWGSVCDEGWDATDGHVVCLQLGYPRQEPVIYKNSYFGTGQYLIVYSNVNCGGWENSLAECDKTDYISLTCPTVQVAGVLCGDDCADGDVRLASTVSQSEGTVEICYNDLWGLISDNGWTDEDARVLCKQLGLPSEGALARVSSYYGKLNKTIHLSGVQCVGDEESLSDCTHVQYSLEEGKKKSDEVAGVHCLQVSTTLVGASSESNAESIIIGTTLSIVIAFLALVVLLLLVILILSLIKKRKTQSSSHDSSTDQHDARYSTTLGTCEVDVQTVAATNPPPSPPVVNKVYGIDDHGKHAASLGLEEEDIESAHRGLNEDTTYDTPTP